MSLDTSLVLEHSPLPLTPPPEKHRPSSSTTGGFSARTAVVAVAVLIAIAAGAAMFIGAGGSTPPSASQVDDGYASGGPAPTFTLPELRHTGGGQVSLSAPPAQPTVINFFAAWCEPCKRELPALRAAAAAYPGVAFLGIDHQDSREDAVELLDRFAITYPAGYDPRGEIAARYGIRGLPATVFIGTDGRIVALVQGELSSKELQERLNDLISRNASE